MTDQFHTGISQTPVASMLETRATTLHVVMGLGKPEVLQLSTARRKDCGILTWQHYALVWVCSKILESFKYHGPITEKYPNKDMIAASGIRILQTSKLLNLYRNESLINEIWNTFRVSRLYVSIYLALFWIILVFALTILLKVAKVQYFTLAPFCQI